MKVLVPVVIGLLVVGCGKSETERLEEENNTTAKPVKELTLEEKVVGTYVLNQGIAIWTHYFLEKGVYWYSLDETSREGRWKIIGNEVHTEEDDLDGYDKVFNINSDGNIVWIAQIRDTSRKRQDFPKDKQFIYKKTTSETKEPPSKKAADALANKLTSLSPGINEIQVEHDGRSRRLIITTPKTFGRQSPYPVLFCFHGAGGKADGPSKRWSPHADKRGLIVISAEAAQPLAKWNFRDKFHAEEHDDVGFVLKVVESLIANKIVDPKTIYATGHSSGGLFCYRLAKEVSLFAAFSPMSCGMVKGAHDPDEKTKFVPILQVIGDQDKSFNGSSNPKVTMYSAAKRIDVWRKFNRCRPDPVVIEKGKEIMVYTYASQTGIEVALCKVKDQGHIIRRNLRDIADSVALDFLLKHEKIK